MADRTKSTYPTPEDARKLCECPHWGSKLRTTISRWNVTSSGMRQTARATAQARRQWQEDLFHDLMVHFLRKNDEGLDYIQRWDPSKGTYATWLYRGVTNYLTKRFHRQHKTQAGAKLTFAASIVMSSGEDDQVGSSEVLERWLPTEHAIDEAPCEMERVLSALEKEAKSGFSWVVYRKDEEGLYALVEDRRGTKKVHRMTQLPVGAEVGVEYSRDETTIFKLMALGLDSGEVAALLRTSTTWLYKQLKIMRKRPVMQEWRASYMER
jgi:hypothetical protein